MKPAVDRNPGLTPALLVLTASGAVALGHQLLWTRRMIDLLGATTESSARVFGCFFLGLALGAAFMSRWISRVTRPWRAIAAVEFGVACFSIPILWLPLWSDWIWPYLGFSRLIEWQGALVKLILSVVIVLPPAFLMGMTMPLALTAVFDAGNEGERHNVPLYAANTLGGALGLGLAVGFLLPAAGVFGAMLVLMGVNLLLGCICLLKDRVAKRSIQQPRPATRRGTTNEASAAINPVTLTQSANGTISWLAMFSGAAVLAVEVLAVEMIHLKLPLSFYPAAAILACVILVLGLAAILVPFLIRRVRSPMRLIPPSLAAAGLSVVLAPVVFMNLGLNETHLGFTTPMIGFMAVLCLSTLLSIGPSMLFAGLVFPLCLASCEGLDRERQFRRISRLLALNGVGGLAGAECAYRVLLPAFGVHVGIGAVGLAYGMVSLAIQAILRSPKEAIRPSDAAPGMPSLEASPAVREPQPNY